jgi:hypothetical protein
LEIPSAPPRGPAVDIIFIFGGGCCRTTDSTPRGPSILQLRRWLLPEIPTAPPGGPPSTSSSSSVVATVGLPTTPPRRLAFDVFNFRGRRCRKYRQHPQGSHHRRCLHLWWWLLLAIPIAPPVGPPSTSSSYSVVAAARLPIAPPGGSHRCLTKLGTCRQHFSGDTYQGGGHHGKHYHYKQGNFT